MQKRIRDIERLIRKRGETEELLAKLDELKNEKKKNDISLKEKKNADKYHMIKFFERKKLVRKILSLEHEAETLSGKELRKSEKKRKRLEEDLCYVLYFPNRMKYIALFANKDNEADDTRSANDERTEELRNQALELAKRAREEDIANGNIDKVVHAIEVGKHPKKKPTGEFGAIEDGEVSQDDSQGSALVDKKRKLENSYDKPLSKPIIEKPEKVSKKSKLENDVTVSNVPNEPEIAEDQAGDSFFLEEAPATERVVDGNSLPSQHRISVGDLRRVVSDRKNYSRIKDNGVLSKQELRLARWQEKVRNKNKVMGGVHNQRGR